LNIHELSYFDDKTCFYIITFNNNLYYYIGSTTNIKKELKNIIEISITFEKVKS
jgi:hypothetical protein